MQSNIRKHERNLRKILSKFLYNSVLHKGKHPKIFCISLQRTGTTSTGQFFRDHGYSVATHSLNVKNNWTSFYWRGDYESIFRSYDFKRSIVFEDDPWWLNDFYKVLYHRFPDSKFILLERNTDQWFDSMIAHSNGKTIGNTHLHCSLYNRLYEFHKTKLGYENIYTNNIDNALPLGEEQREHYTRFYEIRNREVKLFFNNHDNTRLFNASLSDSDLWQKLGEFFSISVTKTYNVHLNKSQSLN